MYSGPFKYYDIENYGNHCECTLQKKKKKTERVRDGGGEQEGTGVVIAW